MLIMNNLRLTNSSRTRVSFILSYHSIVTRYLSSEPPLELAFKFIVNSKLKYLLSSRYKHQVLNKPLDDVEDEIYNLLKYPCSLVSANCSHLNDLSFFELSHKWLGPYKVTNSFVYYHLFKIFKQETKCDITFSTYLIKGYKSLGLNRNDLTKHNISIATTNEEYIDPIIKYKDLVNLKGLPKD